MDIRYSFTILFFVVLGLFACQVKDKEPAPKDVSNQRKDLLLFNEAPKRNPYELQWGDIRVPLQKYANPNVFSGAVEVGFDEFLKAIHGKIQLFRRDRVLDFELVNLSRRPFSWERRLWFSYPELRRGVLPDEVIERLQRGILPGEQLTLHLLTPNDSARFHPVTIRVRDPFAPYQPEVRVGALPVREAVQGFQMIQSPGKPPVLRIDTNAVATRHIYELYREDKWHKIIHIPGFRTRRRLLNAEDRLFTTKDVAKTTFITNEYDRLTLSEFVDMDDEPLVLKWGELEAAPSSPNYRKAEFHNNQFKPLALQVGSHRLPILNFHLYVNNAQLRSQLFITDDVRYPGIQRTLAGLPPESTVYIDQIVIENEARDTLLFPVAFAFNIGREPSYDLHIEESTVTETPEITETDQPGYQAFKMSGYPLTVVLSHLLDIDSGRLEFGDLESDPILSLQFVSARHSLKEGKNLLLRRLMEQYPFSFRISG